MIKKYRKTATIKAERFDGSQDMCDKYRIRAGVDTHYDLASHLFIETFEGRLCIVPGDWIATGVDGEHWPIADEVFKKTYAELPAIPAVVAEYISAAKSEEIDIEDVNVVRATLAAVDYDQSNWLVVDWIQKHGDTFARAWLDGYQIEGAE